jgi:hypothetical protein
MFTFIKKLFGFDQPTMKEAGVQLEQAPYKIEQPIPAGDIVPQPIIVEGAGLVEPAATPVTSQITDAVTQKAEPAKKARKPRAPKVVAEKSAAKKAALVKKAAAIKATTKTRTSRSKKA